MLCGKPACLPPLLGPRAMVLGIGTQLLLDRVKLFAKEKHKVVIILIFRKAFRFINGGKGLFTSRVQFVSCS